MADDARWVRRNFRLLLWMLGWLLAALVVFLVARPGLPDPVAIHWGLDGAPDGSAPLWMLPLVALGASLLGLALAPIFSVDGEPSMEAFATVGMGGGLAVSIVAVTVSANHGVAEWTLAEEIGVVPIVSLFVVPVVGLIGGILLGRHWYPVKTITASRGDREVIEVEPGERVAWVGRARVKWLTFALFGIALLLLFFVPGLPLWAFVLIVGMGLVFSQVEAHVTNDGVRVRLGGVPIRRIGLGDISSARRIDVVPIEMGGWGWRVVPGKTAVVLRAGDAIALTLRSGREFIITVEDAGTGAALVNGLLDRAEGDS